MLSQLTAQSLKNISIAPWMAQINRFGVIKTKFTNNLVHQSYIKISLLGIIISQFNSIHIRAYYYSEIHFVSKYRSPFNSWSPKWPLSIPCLLRYIHCIYRSSVYSNCKENPKKRSRRKGRMIIIIIIIIIKHTLDK
jgi:hypothetical protein